MVTRVTQLVSLMRASLAYTKCSCVRVDGDAAMKRAHAYIPVGRRMGYGSHDSVVWHEAIGNAVSLWLSRAMLTTRDAAMIDLRAILEVAVASTYGLEATRWL